MELSGTIQKIVKQYFDGRGMTDMVIGTVTKIDPALEITLEETMIPLRGDMLVLTDAVIEKRLSINGHIHNINTLTHSHSYTDSDNGSTSTKTTGDALTGSYVSLASMENIICYENNVALPVRENQVIINRGLIVGDKVIMLRVSDGGRFVVWSRVY